MSILGALNDFCNAVFRETSVLPIRIDLEPRAWDKLLAEAGARARVVQMTPIPTQVRPALTFETGFGEVLVTRAEPVQFRVVL